MFIGIDSLNAFAALFLKKIGFVKVVVFYTIDYVPTRFQNAMLNTVYHAIDGICSQKCDWTWNLANAMSVQRKRRGIREGRNLVVPIGYNSSAIREYSPDSKRRYRLAYLGSLRPGQGIQLAIEALPHLLGMIPQIELIIIGSGPLSSDLKAIVKKMGLDAYVTFTGNISRHDDVYTILGTCGIGIAAYEPGQDNFTRFTEPGKVKEYLALGLPVVITKVPEIAREIEARGAGRVIEYNVQAFSLAIAQLVNNKEAYELAQAAALSLVAEYSWTRVFERTFEAVFEQSFIANIEKN
jgi:glycosyltransferase involved in cell wall biosynthesis